MSILKRRGSSSSQGPASGSFVATAEDLGRWASLLEFVAAAEYPDGEKRQPGSIVLFVEEGRLKCCLSDKDQGLVGFLTAETVVGLLQVAEDALAADTVDWRASRASKPQRRS